MNSLKDQFFFPQFLEFLSTNRDLSNHLIFEFGQETFEKCGPVEKANLRRMAELGYTYSLDKVIRLDLNLGELRDRNFKFVKVDAGLLISAADEHADEIRTIDIEGDGEEQMSAMDDGDIVIVDAEYDDSEVDTVADEDCGATVEEDAENRMTRGGLPATSSHIHPADLRQLFGRYGLDLIAQKLETERDVAEVVDLDVDYGQGYLFGSPRPVDHDGVEVNYDATMTEADRLAS